MLNLRYKDFTLKARILNRELLELKLVKQGIKYIGEDYQHDFYFKVSVGKLKFRRGTLGTLITHYKRILRGKIEKTIVYRYDMNPLEEEVNMLFSTEELIGKIKKKRKIYQINNVTIHIDELPYKQYFIEVEAKDFTDNYTELDLQHQCQNIFDQIGISKKDIVPTGYI